MRGSSNVDLRRLAVPAGDVHVVQFHSVTSAGAHVGKQCRVAQEPKHVTVTHQGIACKAKVTKMISQRTTRLISVT